MRNLASIIIALFLALGIVAIAACGGTQKNSDKLLDQDEPKSEELFKILRKTEKMPYLKSLIILKNGELIVEEYLNGGSPHQFYDIRSASKSILSAVLGIAIKNGYIESIDQKVIDFFPEYSTKELDPKVYDLSVRHLITMKSGFKIKETGKVYQKLSFKFGYHHLLIFVLNMLNIYLFVNPFVLPNIYSPLATIKIMPAMD